MFQTRPPPPGWTTWSPDRAKPRLRLQRARKIFASARVSVASGRAPLVTSRGAAARRARDALEGVGRVMASSRAAPCAAACHRVARSRARTARATSLPRAGGFPRSRHRAGDSDSSLDVKRGGFMGEELASDDDAAIDLDADDAEAADADAEPPLEGARRVDAATVPSPRVERVARENPSNHPPSLNDVPDPTLTRPRSSPLPPQRRSSATATTECPGCPRRRYTWSPRSVGPPSRTRS
jgi:hypothetical protein